MSEKRKITVAYGDGIGPEIMELTLRILEAAGAQIEPEVIEIGEKVYQSGVFSGIRPEAWESLRRTKVFLKSPITTPQGGGYKSLNVTTRKALGLFANVRPVSTLNPFVASKHTMDLVIVRENEEDLYAGIEHQQTQDTVQCLKLISKQGSEKIIRYAFEYARAYNRKKVTCFSKDNIMKLTDGLFHKMFDEIGKEYPEIEKEHRIIDIGSALLADTPEKFDVIVTLNLYGDIISDIAAQVAGSVGLCGSANIGDQCAMFEAIHGSAPDIAGKGIANPSGLINGALMMLVHINQPEVAEKIHNAWLKTLEDGIHTGDIYKEGVSKVLAGSKEFTDAVIERLGQKPQILKAVSYPREAQKGFEIKVSPIVKQRKDLTGFDLFLENDQLKPEEIAEKLKALENDAIYLAFISNRGLKVWPDGLPESFCTAHWRCRFKARNISEAIRPEEVWKGIKGALELGLDVIKTENLYTFDGKRGYTDAQ
ncbi:MAG TPA: NADP-dependent isocitrate dehydrogenase, partial [Catalimonadaceae bacterium]|nr:NADP-dependent isocitrate dehydrogenase [Catalimonadaceae bacterium]